MGATIAKKMAITDLPQMVSQQHYSGGAAMHGLGTVYTQQAQGTPSHTGRAVTIVFLLWVVGTVAACSANTAAT